MRPLFLYWNPVDFGQPGDSGPNDAPVADQYISRYLGIAGSEVKQYRRYKPLLDSVRDASMNGGLPTVLFCVGVSERQLRERLKGLLDAGACKLLVYVAENADSEPSRRAILEVGSLCCWDSRVFPAAGDLTSICTTDKSPYTTWVVNDRKLPPQGAVFVACSYDPDRRSRFEAWVRIGIELTGLKARFADGRADARGAASVNRQTIEQIKKSHLIVAIMDEPYNCNAVYEIGIADAFQIPAIIYQQQGSSDLPVDIRERVHDRFTSPEDLGYRLHHGLRDAVERSHEKTYSVGS